MTKIEIRTSIASYLSDENNPYYGRTMVTLHLSSTTKFDRVRYNHLGFHASGAGKRDIKHKGDRYHLNGLLDPNVDASILIPPFKLYLKNVGDSFLSVHVRLPNGMERCKLTILQEQHQPKPPKDVDDFIKFEGIWYCTAVINCLQTIRIEEIVQEEREDV